MRDQMSIFDEGDEFSPVLECSLPVVTRTEFKDEVDVNRIMSRYGAVFGPPIAAFGEFEFDSDLQEAFAMVERGRGLWSRLPKELRERYGSLEAVIEAVEAGKVVLSKPKESGTVLAEEKEAPKV